MKTLLEPRMGSSLFPFNQSGYSFIELSLVLCIIGTVAAMASVSFDPHAHKATFETNVAKLQESLFNARQMARGRSSCVEVTMDSGVLQLRAFKAANCASPVGATAAGDYSVQFDAGIAVTGAVAGVPAQRFVFNEHGGLTDNESIQLTIVSQGQSESERLKAKFKILPLIGQIRRL